MPHEPAPRTIADDGIQSATGKPENRCSEPAVGARSSRLVLGPRILRACYQGRKLVIAGTDVDASGCFAPGRRKGLPDFLFQSMPSSMPALNARTSSDDTKETAHEAATGKARNWVGPRPSVFTSSQRDPERSVGRSLRRHDARHSPIAATASGNRSHN